MSWWYDDPDVWRDCYTPDTVDRSVEYEAFNNIYDQARTHWRVAGKVDFDATHWDIYIRDLDMRTRRNAIYFTADAIATRLGTTRDHVERTQREIDDIMLNRETQGLPQLPPVPLAFLRRYERVQQQLHDRQVDSGVRAA
jgi:hypothetical protein